MKRNIEKCIEEGKKAITERQELTTGEVYELGQGDKVDAIVNAFYMGAAIGARAERARR